MQNNVFIGKKVRLEAVDAERDGKLMSSWMRNTEYARLMDSDPIHFWSSGQVQQWLDKQQKENGNQAFTFMIIPLEAEQPVGFIDLNDIIWHTGEGWIGIGIGDPDSWSRGYGSDAMRIMARFAFEELGLHRLSLNVFDYNPRAIHVYEKIGFKVEGCLHEAVHRDGKRWDLIFMGLLKNEWIGS